MIRRINLGTTSVGTNSIYSTSRCGDRRGEVDETTALSRRHPTASSHIPSEGVRLSATGRSCCRWVGMDGWLFVTAVALCQRSKPGTCALMY
jgi:hypothetical protein